MSLDSMLALIDEDLTIQSNKPRKLGYVIEPEKITLSFSRLATLRTCPRKFLLKELNQKAPGTATIDTAYGSAFGAGVQALFTYDSIERGFVSALAEWDFEGFDAPFKNKADKDLWSCCASLDMFYNTEFQALHSEYKLADIDGKSGVELFVYMALGDSYNYQVHVDLVLQNRETNALVVAEIKTSGAEQEEANWYNAEQTLGYYAILEFISKKYGYAFEPRVIYITCWAGRFLEMEKNYGFTTFVFEKPFTLSLDFARNVVVDVETIELYIYHNYWPKRGNACKTYGRVCEFFGQCDMEYLQNPDNAEHGSQYESLTMEDVDFTFDLAELIGRLDNLEAG